MKKKTILILSAIATALLINASAYAIQGDLDGSGIVDGLDLAILSTSFGLDSDSPSWKPAADIADNGLVDGVDLSSLAPNFGKKAGVGSVAANIVWDDGGASGPMSKPNNLASKPLAKVANIDTVFINISAADMTPMSKTFSYSSNGGEIGGVPAGIRILTVIGYNGVTPIFKGTKTITVRAGEITYETIYATAIDLTDTVVPKLAGGFAHSLALKSDGTIWAWGLNDVGQFGDSTQASSSVPVDTNQVGTNQTGYIDIDSERYNAIGIRFNGTVSTWGAKGCGQLGNDDENVTGYQCPPASPPTDFESSPVWVEKDYFGDRFDNVTAVSAGGKHMAALKNDGTVWTWGYNQYGQLGDNTSGDADKSAPVQVKVSAFNNLTAVIAISAGFDHTLALKSDGTVWACGYNSSGQIGDDTLFDKNVATQVVDNAGTGFLSDIVEVAVGTDHSVALANNSTVWAWGDNEWGQVGGGSVFPNHTALTPVQVVDVGGTGALSNIKAIAAGGFFTLALAYDDTLYAWGRNDFGQLGNNSTIDSSVPIVVNGITGTVESIFAGDEHALVMTTDGNIWAWGKDEDDQLGAVSSDPCIKGVDTYKCSLTPLQVPAF